MKSSVIAIDRGLCVVHHRAREGCIDETRHRYFFRQPPQIQLIGAGTERQYRPQIDKTFKAVIRYGPNQRYVHTLRIRNVALPRKGEILKVSGERCAPFLCRIDIAVKKDAWL